MQAGPPLKLVGEMEAGRRAPVVRDLSGLGASILRLARASADEHVVQVRDQAEGLRELMRARGGLAGEGGR